jgi:eukaryotic-like serine/threonine-protein kinase
MGYDTVLRWYGRDGRALDAVNVPARYSGYAVSPDGRRVAFARYAENGTRDIWVKDLTRGSETKRTFSGDASSPVWSQDGMRLVFASARDGFPPNVFTDVGAGSAGEKRLTESRLVQNPTGWGPDGDAIVYEVADQDGLLNLWRSRVQDGQEESLPVNSPFNEWGGAVSPDGRWLAYVTDRSGQDEVWIARFPSGEDGFQVSVDGGTAPTWRGDGRELFYVSAQHELTAITIDTTAAVARLGKPGVLFTLENAVGLFDPLVAMYSPTADGQRFLVAVRADTAPTPINVVLNWTAGLQK